MNRQIFPRELNGFLKSPKEMNDFLKSPKKYLKIWKPELLQLIKIIRNWVSLFCRFSPCINLQMSNFMSGNDDTTESTSILNDGYTVNLFESLIDHACTSNVSESYTEKFKLNRPPNPLISTHKPNMYKTIYSMVVST